MTVEIVESDVLASAAEVESAATQVGALDLGSRMDAVRAALPGSTSAAAATGLAEEWRGDVSRWAAAAHRQRGDLEQASRQITQADVRVSTHLGRPGMEAV